MATPNAFESCCMQEVMGDTLRPGGFSLTDIAVDFCSLTPNDSVLDLGCGRGATVNYLFDKYHITAAGIDSSEKLIEEAKSICQYDAFFLGKGEQLPFDQNTFDCVFAECTLSLMDADKAIEQVHRVLKESGWFVISDVYAKNPEAIDGLKSYSINSCMRGMHSLEQLKSRLEQDGFTIAFLGDYSYYLKELLVKIGFSYGSMCDFWNTASDCCVNGDDFYRTIKLCKPGYFMLIARKRSAANE